GDPHHPARKEGKITPDPLEMPYGYGVLLTWYRIWGAAPSKPPLHDHPLLALQRTGKQLRRRKQTRKSSTRSSAAPRGATI
ncbi:MAG TPA: hypothetical protein VEH50_13480, partial [Methylomirabilota bacterium]|nr:hypothetical protein [Methylomirabilota bacterium]